MVALLPAIALAKAPPGVDLTSPLHEWFEKQHSVTGRSCCGEADGHILADDEWRARGADGYEVLIDGQWYPTTASDLLREDGGPNLTYHAVVWYTKNDSYTNIYCFTPGWQS